MFKGVDTGGCAAAVERAVAKHLHHLQPEEVREEFLLKVKPVLPFLRELS